LSTEELAVDTALLRVLARTVWLAERLYRIKMPTINRSVTLPEIMLQRISLRREVLFSLLTGLDNAKTTSAGRVL